MCSIPSVWRKRGRPVREALIADPRRDTHQLLGESIAAHLVERPVEDVVGRRMVDLLGQLSGPPAWRQKVALTCGDPLQPQRDSNPCRHLESASRPIWRVRSGAFPQVRAGANVCRVGLRPAKLAGWSGKWSGSSDRRAPSGRLLTCLTGLAIRPWTASTVDRDADSAECDRGQPTR